MFKHLIWISIVVILGIAFFFNLDSTQKKDNKFRKDAINKVGFELLDPEMAPSDIKPLVMKGFNIMCETKKYAPNYAGDKINCTNCHFSAGNTLGGENGGISLVGVNRIYPKKLPSGVDYTLEERINNCFLHSLNGKAMPIESEEMKSIVTYLEWISKNVPESSNMPWLGVKILKSKHTPNAGVGKKIYEIFCAMCHGSQGKGQDRSNGLSYPPVWGDTSFNDAAGMNQLPKMAGFLYENMPYNYPSLSENDALDVAAFLLSKPRPHFDTQSK